MNHYDLAKLCKESYRYVTFTVAECEVLLKYEAGVLHVICRGTEVPKPFPKQNFLGNLKNAWDVIRDMRVIPWYDKDLGWCHAGFLKGGVKVAELIVKHLDVTQPVHFTGHSLGGALSLVCAAKLSAHGYNVKQWVGFASPKVHFMTRKRFRFRQVNYRFRNDVVPLMPRVRGYRHNYPVIRLMSDEINRGPATWLDHSIDKYIKALRKDTAALL